MTARATFTQAGCNERYGRTNPAKILNARNELRNAIASCDIERIQAAWNRLEPWIDAPQGLPLNMGNEKAPPIRQGPGCCRECSQWGQATPRHTPRQSHQSGSRLSAPPHH